MYGCLYLDGIYYTNRYLFYRLLIAFINVDAGFIIIPNW